MNQTIEMQEIAIVVIAENHRPTMLNLEFLQCSGIIEADWELARQPIFNGQASQLLFQNGIGLTAQGNQLIFVESMATKSPQEMQVGQIAQKYLQALPNANYQVAGINLRGLVLFNGAEDSAKHYLMNTLLAPGDWQTYGDEPARASVNFTYNLTGRRLHLSISDAAVQLPDGATTPILLFSGNFEYPIEGDLTKLLGVTENWQADLAAYQDLINNRFLRSGQVSLPMSQPELVSIEA